MLKKKIVIGAVALIALSIAVFMFRPLLKPAKAFIDSSDQKLVGQGRILYGKYCASCHGAGLRGQPEWRIRLSDGRLPAPPHDESGHTWHHPDAVLFDIVKHGLVPGRTAPEGYESNMPAYGNIMSDTDIVAVLAYIKSRWPEDVREAQKEVTEQAVN